MRIRGVLFGIALLACGVTSASATDPGWTVGAPGDSATSGLWVRADPVGTWTGAPPNVLLVQPGDDHTPSGTQCFVTGNADTLLTVGANDVDDGTTTLTTAAFDALTGMVRPMVEYYRWYSNNAGDAPGTDRWETDISNDGGSSWTRVEYTNQTDLTWQRILFRIADYLPPTANMKMRFLASDLGDPSVVEAAVDDFRLLDFPPGTVSAEPPAGPQALSLAPAYPNPFQASATLRFTLPSAGRVRLGFYDVSGRVVRTLVDDVLPAGPHAAQWDGRDALGHPLPGGLYFARLEASGREAVQRLMRLP